MKLISWNCNMAFRKKWVHIKNNKPDILVIQECENKEKLNIEKLIPDCTSSIWVGENPHKGVGIFAFNDFQLELSKMYTPEYKYIIPIHISGKSEYTLFAIWAMPNKEKPSLSYVGQIWNAIHFYDSLFDDRTILAGDFNSNQIWDKSKRNGNHTDVVQFLENKNIHSVYHKKRKENPGQESQPTLYLLKNEKKPYHMDYCFLSKNLIRRNSTIDISSYEETIKFSDHMTVIVNHIKN